MTSRADYTILRRSLYAAGHFSLADPLKLVAGVSLANLSSNGQRLDSAHAYDKTKATPYLGLTYDLDSHYSVYGSYTRIFNPQYLLDQSQALLDPIEGNNLEAGIKGEWHEGRLNASLAVFRTRQQNTAEYAGWDAVKGFGYYRPVDTTVQGYDLTLAGRLAPGWELNAGLTHLFSIRDGKGQTTRTFTPRNSFYLATSYRLPQLPDLKIGTSVQWQSDIYRHQGTTANGRPIVSRQASYAVVNAMLSYRIGKRLTASLNINNLFDRKYLTSLYWEQAFYAPGRHITAGLTWQY